MIIDKLRGFVTIMVSEIQIAVAILFKRTISLKMRQQFVESTWIYYESLNVITKA